MQRVAWHPIAGMALTALIGFFVGQLEWFFSSAVDEGRWGITHSSPRESAFVEAPSELRAPATNELSNENARNAPTLPDDFERDLHTALAMGSDLRRDQALCHLALSLDPAQFPAAIERVLKAPGQMRWMAIRLFASRWVELDPQAAVAFAASTRDLRRDTLFNVIVSTWAASDPDAALAFAQSLPDRARGAVALTSVLNALMHREPHRALALLQTPEMAAQRTDFVGSLFSDWGSRDPMAAASAALALPKGRRLPSASRRNPRPSAAGGAG